MPRKIQYSHFMPATLPTNCSWKCCENPAQQCNPRPTRHKCDAGLSTLHMSTEHRTQKISRSCSGKSLISSDENPNLELTLNEPFCFLSFYFWSDGSDQQSRQSASFKWLHQCTSNFCIKIEGLKAETPMPLHPNEDANGDLTFIILSKLEPT